MVADPLLSGIRVLTGFLLERCVMPLDPNYHERLADLEERLHSVDTVTSGLMSDAIAIACARFGVLGAATEARVKWLIEAGAWTDATIALLELELPEWKLRRLVNDNGKWLCSLSKQSGIPLRRDEVAEASHESLPLAILIALLQARRSLVGGVIAFNTAQGWSRDVSEDMAGGCSTAPMTATRRSLMGRSGSLTGT
jgi:hypothetical protein